MMWRNPDQNASGGIKKYIVETMMQKYFKEDCASGSRTTYAVLSINHEEMYACSQH